MTIYVDPLFFAGDHYHGEHAALARSVGQRHGHLWCHLITDGPDEELHAFAESIGMERRWAQEQGPTLHYDLTPPRRALAVQKGAVEVSELELGSLIDRKRHGRRADSGASAAGRDDPRQDPV